MFKWIAVIAGAAMLGALAYVALSCPCERVPGMKLGGPEHSESVDDWTFANDAGLCQLEVAGLIPHSINLNCMSDGRALYVSCSRCDGKYWSGIALTERRGRVRIGETVYPVGMDRVTDITELDHAWGVRAQKLRSLGRDSSGERPDHWWSFRLSSASS